MSSIFEMPGSTLGSESLGILAYFPIPYRSFPHVAEMPRVPVGRGMASFPAFFPAGGLVCRNVRFSAGLDQGSQSKG